MKALILLIPILITIHATAQNGYIILAGSDSVMTGFIKPYRDVSSNQPGLEYWRTKTDKNPLKFLKEEIWEYAIKKDTFRILTNYKPFQNTATFFDLAEAKAVSRGKVNFYIIEDYANPNRVSTYTGGGLVPAIIDASVGNYPYMYLIEDETSYKALPSNKSDLLEILKDFFPAKYLVKYEEVKGEIGYRTLPDAVRLYNTK